MKSAKGGSVVWLGSKGAKVQRRKTWFIGGRLPKLMFAELCLVR